MSLFKILIIFSGASFLVYGVKCIFSNEMINEFLRFRLSKYRVLTGLLEIIGGAGQLIGLYFFPRILLIATLGLSVLMAMGFIVRLKIKDGFIRSFPAFFYMILNVIILILGETL